ncbi:YitT family protein [Mycoplasmopsis cynos]|nr:YitT family protein [Mycoplasmopsis cynos]
MKAFLTSVFGKEKQDEIADALMGKDIFSNRLVKKNTIYNRTRMSNFGIKLSKLYSQMSTWKLVLITTITAIFFGVISVFFVKNVGIYNFGLFTAFGQALARLVVVLFKEDQVSIALRNLIEQFIFWIAYIILSIPIFIFGYKKIGKTFSNLTVLFLVVSSIVSFSIGLIPGANDIYLIGDFSNQSVRQALSPFKQKLSSIIPLLWNDGGNIIALFIYAIVYGYLLVWIFAIIQIIGGTAGVTGIIGEWYANEKQKSFGTISGYMNIIIVLIGVLVGSWFLVQYYFQVLNSSNASDSLKEVTKNAWSFGIYLSPNFVATVLTNVIYIIALNKLYPKFKLVRVEIFSLNKSSEISTIIAQDKKIVTGITEFRTLTVDIQKNS